MAGSHLPYLALALGTCSKWPCFFSFGVGCIFGDIPSTISSGALYIYIYVYIYIYLHMYYVGRTDRI